MNWMIIQWEKEDSPSSIQFLEFVNHVLLLLWTVSVSCCPVVCCREDPTRTSHVLKCEFHQFHVLSVDWLVSHVCSAGLWQEAAVVPVWLCSCSPVNPPNGVAGSQKTLDLLPHRSPSFYLVCFCSSEDGWKYLSPSPSPSHESAAATVSCFLAVDVDMWVTKRR